MAEDAADLLTHALKLPPAARAALADSLIDSLDTEVDEDAEEAWRSEIALRVRDLDSGAVQTIAWDEVRTRLRSRFNGWCGNLFAFIRQLCRMPTKLPLGTLSEAFVRQFGFWMSWIDWLTSSPFRRIDLKFSMATFIGRSFVDFPFTSSFGPTASMLSSLP
jgi:putative addiction module component (TIGR02574 family)